MSIGEDQTDQRSMHSLSPLPTFLEAIKWEPQETCIKQMEKDSCMTMTCGDTRSSKGDLGLDMYARRVGQCRVATMMVDGELVALRDLMLFSRDKRSVAAWRNYPCLPSSS